MKLDMLRCFVMVARCGNLADAAQTLGRTPSAVSMMLKQFEDHVGATLFETARKSRLTALGALIYEEASRGVSQFENTVAVIEGLSRSQFGYLRLAVPPSVASTILPPIIRDFVAAHPKVQLDIRDMDSATIANELRRERVDIGIGTLPELEGMRRVELFSDAFGVVCRKDAEIVRAWDTFTWSSLQDQTLISNGLCEMIADPDFATILETSRLHVPNTTSLLSLVREGVGITVLPKTAVMDLGFDLAFLPIEDKSARRSVQMVCPRVNHLMPAASAFVALVEAAKRSGVLNYAPS